MRRRGAKGALALLSAALAVGGCAGTPGALSPTAPATRVVSAPGCATHDVAIAFDFEGASQSRCVIEGPRNFSLLIGPDHAPPINPSAWYAFRYRAGPGAPVALTLRYVEAKHRYAPKLTSGGAVTDLAVTTEKDGRSAHIELPPGEGVVSGQPLVGSADYGALSLRLEKEFGASRLTIGQSLDGRRIEALRMGAAEAPRLIVLLGRQHPPEVTGSYAMEPFLLELAAVLKEDPALAARYQVLAVPFLNPDGVMLGHWRANRGGMDLNRDWGDFTQPETRAVRDYLAGLSSQVRPVVMLDFHSTWRNLFYVQGTDATPAQAKFVGDWLGGKEAAFVGYPFAIEPSAAEPGSQTSKTWFHATYAIPTITYEVGDRTAAEPAAAAARELARSLIPALEGR